MALKEYFGIAGFREQIDYITLGGVYVAADIVNVTIGNSTLSIILGTDTVALTAVRDVIVAAVNALVPGAGLVGLEVRLATGQLLPEFRDVVAYADPQNTARLIVYSKVSGTPFGTPAGGAMTVSKTSAAGTITRAAVQTATGPNDYANTVNWTGGTLPVTADDMFFAAGQYGPKWNLPTGTFQPASITIEQSVGRGYELSGFPADLSLEGWQFGLPDMNINNGTPYREYRQVDAQFNAAHTAATLLSIGRGTGPGPQLVRLTFNGADTLQCKGIIHNTGTPQVGGSMSHVVYLKAGGATNTGNLIINGGHVALAPNSGEVMGFGTDAVQGLQIGRASSTIAPNVLIGAGVDINDTLLTFSGGTTELRCDVIDVGVAVSNIKVAGIGTRLNVVGNGLPTFPRIDRLAIGKDSIVGFLTNAMIGKSLINDGLIDLRNGAGDIAVGAGAVYDKRSAGTKDDPADRLQLTDFTGGSSGA